MPQTDHAGHIKTIFCDIDGCIFSHGGSIDKILLGRGRLLPGVLETFCRWASRGYTVVLTTGRPEGFRRMTEQQLQDAGLFYHQLVMGLPRGERVIINDFKPSRNMPTTACVNLSRNEGMENVDI